MAEDKNEFEDNKGALLPNADKNKHPIENERPMQKLAKPKSTKAVAGSIVPKKGADARVDFKADERRLASMDKSNIGAAGVVITDKKVMVLPNGLKVENN